MKRTVIALGLLLLTASVAGAQTPGSQEPSWHIDAVVIEACSCNLFCPCWFNGGPGREYCLFNFAIQVKKGHYGSVKLDGMKIWKSGDGGSDLTDGELDSQVVTFEPSATAAQVDAALKVLAHIYPLTVKAAALDRAPIVWEASEKGAYAKLGDGQAEVALTPTKGADGSAVVINNLRYWGAERNNGFRVGYSRHHYKGHGLDYTFTNTSGLLTEVESGTP
jgi:hypothetical protein